MFNRAIKRVGLFFILVLLISLIREELGIELATISIKTIIFIVGMVIVFFCFFGFCFHLEKIEKEALDNNKPLPKINHCKEFVEWIKKGWF